MQGELETGLDWLPERTSFTQHPPFPTGMYDTPTLWVHPGPQVTPGEPVTLYCRLEIATSMFVLLKEGRPHRVQHGRGPVQAEFPLGPVTAAHQGAYRCFGSYNSHAWSFPSKAVELLIEGEGSCCP